MTRRSLTPRKQPRQARATATVDAILEAAAHVLELHGLEGYNTNAIAERAGASIGSLYQYFPNKDALTRALIARQDATLLAALDALRGEGTALLRNLVRTAVAHQLQRPRLARLLDAEEARLPLRDEAERLRTTLGHILRRSLGDKPLDRSPHLAQDLFAIIRGMVDAAGEAHETNAAELSKRVERAVLGYLG